MSKKQWGHGYWHGVQDAINGTVNLMNLEEKTILIVCLMCIWNNKKQYDQSLFPVWQFNVFVEDSGMTKRQAKNIYNYVLQNEPYGCYVSGDEGDDWLNDWFVLPNMSKDECERIIKSITNKFINAV